MNKIAPPEIDVFNKLLNIRDNRRVGVCTYPIYNLRGYSIRRFCVVNSSLEKFFFVDLENNPVVRPSVINHNINYIRSDATL